MSYEDREREFDQRRIPLVWMEDDELHAAMNFAEGDIERDVEGKPTKVTLIGHGLKKIITLTWTGGKLSGYVITLELAQ